jgi:hypothetical protein
MKITELQKIVKTAVKEAIQEEIKDILLEAVRSPKPTVYEHKTTPQHTPSPISSTDRMAMRENIQNVLGGMMPGANGTISANTNNMPLQMHGPMDTASPNGKLPEGDVSMDQIMGLMNKK